MIRKALGSDDRATREGAVVVLGGAGKLAVPLLKEVLNGPPEMRSPAVTAAEALGADAAPLVPELVEALKDRGTRWTAERALVKIKVPAVGPLVSALSSEDAAVRESAAEGAALLTIYSAGLAVPFLLAGWSIEAFFEGFGRIKRHFKKLEIGSGIILVGVGLLLVIDRLSWLNSRFSFMNEWVNAAERALQ